MLHTDLSTRLQAQSQRILFLNHWMLKMLLSSLLFHFLFILLSIYRHTGLALAKFGKESIHARFGGFFLLKLARLPSPLVLLELPYLLRYPFDK